METIQTESVTGFRNNYREVLKWLDTGPVMLLQSSKVAAVMVSADEWNQLQRYKRLAKLEELSRQIDAGDYQTQEQIEAGLRERGLMD